ncbi:MAG TPA: leucyl aminopeptidase [Streptosporangiaceae bacterium]|jgi:leucyl aminopeptidase|nr:leucyl aminopeptidase [Streptosporangiaceae bacterium]
MMIHASEASARATEADALIVGVIQGADGPRPAPGARDADEALGGNLADLLTALDATGRPEEITKIPAAGRLPVPLIVAVGLGRGSGDASSGNAAPGGAEIRFDPETLRRAAGAAVRALTSGRAAARPDDEGLAPGSSAGGGKRRIALALPARDAAEAEAVALGALLGGYVFRRYRTTGVSPDAELTMLTTGLAGPAGQAAAGRAQVLADAVALVRDLVNTGPSDLVPATFAAEAERVAAACGLAVQVLDENDLAEGGYGGIVGVGQGSVHPPRLVRLEYTHPDAARTLVLAGKGITFDSGGLSLKPPKSMEWMKADMGGAAAVLGALQAISALKPAVNVIGYLPLAENMPSGSAQRPSDVITIHGGKTVEVLNTDAEGRLVLADALARSAADSPDLIVDIATLTGAQLVALGPRVSGVMANSDALAADIAAAAGRAGEAAWPMPLPEELRKGLDSSVADLANIPPDKNGGMLVAGLFLREFVPGGVPWAHIDIAGPSFNEGEASGYTPRGGTGAATRALVQIAEDVAGGKLAPG